MTLVSTHTHTATCNKCPKKLSAEGTRIDLWKKVTAAGWQWKSSKIQLCPDHAPNKVVKAKPAKKNAPKKASKPAAKKKVAEKKPAKVEKPLIDLSQSGDNAS